MMGYGVVKKAVFYLFSARNQTLVSSVISIQNMILVTILLPVSIGNRYRAEISLAICYMHYVFPIECKSGLTCVT